MVDEDASTLVELRRGLVGVAVEPGALAQRIAARERLRGRRGRAMFGETTMPAPTTATRT
jgi:hypothetical protein